MNSNRLLNVIIALNFISPGSIYHVRGLVSDVYFQFRLETLSVPNQYNHRVYFECTILHMFIDHQQI